MFGYRTLVPKGTVNISMKNVMGFLSGISKYHCQIKSNSCTKPDIDVGSDSSLNASFISVHHLSYRLEREHTMPFIDHPSCLIMFWIKFIDVLTSPTVVSHFSR